MCGLCVYSSPGMAVLHMQKYDIVNKGCIFCSNRIFTEGTCKLLNLIISDMVDEDFVLHNRERPVSALLFGTSSLLSKPGQTLAPLFGTLMLSAFTGRLAGFYDAENMVNYYMMMHLIFWQVKMYSKLGCQEASQSVLASWWGMVEKSVNCIETRALLYSSLYQLHVDSFNCLRGGIFPCGVPGWIGLKAYGVADIWNVSVDKFLRPKCCRCNNETVLNCFLQSMIMSR